MSTKIRAKKEGKEKELIKKTPAFIAFFTVIFIILALHCVSLIDPFIWLFLNSLKTNYEYISNSSLLLPQDWLFRNYIDVFTAFEVRDTNFLMMFFNSIWWSVGNTVVGVFMGCVVSYVVSRYDFKAKNIIYGVIMFTMMFPVYGAGAAAYQAVVHLGDLRFTVHDHQICGRLRGFSVPDAVCLFQGLAERLYGSGGNRRRGRFPRVHTDHDAPGYGAHHGAFGRVVRQLLERLHDADYSIAFFPRFGYGSVSL